MSSPAKEPQNGVDGVLKTADPSECDPCIDEKKINQRFWELAEDVLQEKTGLSRNGILNVFGLILAIFTLTITIIVLLSLWPTTPHHQKFPVCSDAACLRASAQIQQYINESGSKCDDFIGWACGSWFAKTTLPDGKSKWNQRTEISFQEASRIRDLITTLSLPVHRGSVEWKIKYLYDACVEVENVNTDAAQPLTRIISELGGWCILRNWNLEEFDYKVTLNHLHVKYGVAPFFKISVVPNPRSPGNNSIAISPAGLGLPDRNYYYMPQFEPITAAYKQLIRDVVITLSTPKTDAEKFGKDIFFYEQRIAEITPDTIDLINPVNTYNPIKLSELKFTTSTLPLQDMLTAMFPTAHIDGTTEVIVPNLDYLLKVSQIIASTDRTTMNSYLIWTLVREFLPYLSSQFVSAVDGYESELYGLKKPLKRWEFCANLVQKFMPLAIDVILEKQNPINDETKEKINSMFTNTRRVVEKHLKNKYSDTPDLFSHLVKKLNSIKLQIGLPSEVTTDSYIKAYYNTLIILKANLFDSYKYGIDFFKKLEERRLSESTTEDYIVNLAIKQPFDIQYCPSKNIIVIPRALLIPPTFEIHYPNSIIYGKLGVDLTEAILQTILPYESAWSADMKLLSQFHMTVNDSTRLIIRPTNCISNFSRDEKLVNAESANLTSLSSYKYLSSLSITHEALGLALDSHAHIHQPSLEVYEDSTLFYLTHIQSLCTISTKQQDFYDNIVNFKLSEMSQLHLARHYDKSLATALECSPPNSKHCGIIF